MSPATQGWGVGVIGAYDQPSIVHPPPPPPPPPPPEDCGITDKPLRGDIFGNLGVSDSSIPWSVYRYGGDSSYPTITAGKGVLHYVGDDLGVALPFTDPTYEATIDLTPHFATASGTEILIGGMEADTDPRSTGDGYADIFHTGTQWQFHVYGNGSTGSVLGGFSIVSDTVYTLHFVQTLSTLTVTVSAGGSVVVTATASHTADHEAFFILMYPHFPYSGTDTLSYQNLDIVGVNRCTATTRFPFDDWQRALDDGWGRATSGYDWAPSIANSGFVINDVDGADGRIIIQPGATVFTGVNMLTGGGGSDPWNAAHWTMTGTVSLFWGDLTGDMVMGFEVRKTDLSASVFINLFGDSTAQGTDTVPTALPFSLVPSAFNVIDFKWEVQPGVLDRFKVWLHGDPEPGSWFYESAPPTISTSDALQFLISHHSSNFAHVALSGSRQFRAQVVDFT